MRRFLLRVFNLFARERAETNLRREMESHLTLLEDEFRRRGMSDAEAHFAARRAFGGVEHTKERQAMRVPSSGSTTRVAICSTHRACCADHRHLRWSRSSPSAWAWAQARRCSV